MEIDDKTKFVYLTLLNSDGISQTFSYMDKSLNIYIVEIIILN